MTDAALNWNDFGADINIENGDIAADNGLATAVLISLFTDARAPTVKLLPPGETELRGWWGDITEDKTGSLLWLIDREKVLPETAERAREYCDNCLRWLREDDIAENVTIDAQLVRPFGLQIKIAIERGSALRYSYLWDAVKEYVGVTVQNTSIQLQFIE